MNRRERRQQERADRRRRTVELPEGMMVRADVLTSLGETQEVTNWRQIPAKRQGVHRWIVAVTHYLSPEEAEAFDGRSPGSPVTLGAASVMFAGLGCVDCEGEYRTAAGSPCPAGDEWKNHG